MGSPEKIATVYWIAENRGLVSLTSDWKPRTYLPPLYWKKRRTPLRNIERASVYLFAERSGYYGQGRSFFFYIKPDKKEEARWREHGLYVAGDFNDWDTSKAEEWELKPSVCAETDEVVFELELPRKQFSSRREYAFKFVDGEQEWVDIPGNAPNVITNEMGIQNWKLSTKVSGKHLFVFETPETVQASGQAFIRWKEETYREVALVLPGDFHRELGTDLSLGAEVRGQSTRFRIFAPRANQVDVAVYSNLQRTDLRRYALEMVDGNCWEALVPGNLSGAYYHYHIQSTASDPHSIFNGEFEVLDPYAKATVSHEGPGIIVAPERLVGENDGFVPPHWQDLVICEAHVRDLLATAPIPLDDWQRLGFEGLRAFVESDRFYVSDMGFNAIELQPIQQNDAQSIGEYHWGYMTTNYFSPNAYYGLDPETGSQVEEFRALVKAFHQKGLAVILDVVYNHVGEPNFLQIIDKHYYFDLDDHGNFMNWSGCGNTFNAHTPMGKRLIVDSLVHLIKSYGVDGFRFDLAELIGCEPLKDIEKAVKKVKPDVILITEPWSFRGHIGYALKKTGYSSWNDGYREFFKDYVKGDGNGDGLKYFLKGSLDHLTAWPAQTVNYVESHDDLGWLDCITENAEHNGDSPTINDRRRTHLMVSCLMMSLGIPMLSAGQDMLRSKHGVKNTYQRGDLNALDYSRAHRYPATQDYFRKWIAFRRSALSKSLRLFSRPGEHYFQFFPSTQNSSGLAIFNADCSEEGRPLAFAVNPHFEWSVINYEGIDLASFTQIADAERFEETGLKDPLIPFDDEMVLLPPMTCALWVG